MTPKNKVTRAIKTSPNIRSQICSKNGRYQLLCLLCSSDGILSVNRVHHGVQTIAKTISPVIFLAAIDMEEYLSKLQSKLAN
jgi:hypothetical protein